MKLTKDFKKASFVLALMILTIGIKANDIVGSWSDPNCHQFNTDGKCEICSYRYYMNHETGQCIKVSDFCETWDEDTGKCLSCYPGYGEPVDGECSRRPTVGSGDVDPNCKCHNDDRVCIQCYNGYHFDSSSLCVEDSVGEPGDHCVSWTYIDTHGKKYHVETEGCRRVCEECEAGFYLDGNYECQPYPADCVAVNEHGVCTQCAEGYELGSDGQCILVVGNPEDDHCAEHGFLSTKGKWYDTWRQGCIQACKRCIEGYYLDIDFICRELPANCVAADEYGQCTQCAEEYQLNDSHECVSVSTPQDDHCLKYWWIDENGKKYSKQREACEKICRKCVQGYYLSEYYECLPLPQNCYKADPSGTCTQCNEGYDFDQQGNCVEIGVSNPEDDHCAVYKYVDSHGKWYDHQVEGCQRVCTQCESGYEFDSQGNCVQVTLQIPEEDHCAVWKYVDSHGKWHDEEAEDCQKICKECEQGYEFDSEGNCVQIVVSIPDDDHCAIWKYVDSHGKWHDEEVEDCQRVCKKCEEGYQFDADGNCVPISVQGPIDDFCIRRADDGTCELCAFRTVKYEGECKKVSDQCQEWDETTGQCTNCYGGYKLSEGDCVRA